MTPVQCRAARALLEWRQSRLAEAAQVGLSTVVDFEKARRRVSDEGVAALARALETAGVEFTNGNAPGVRLRRRGPVDEGLRPDQLNAENDG